MINRLRRWCLRILYLVAKIYWWLCNPVYRGAKVVITCGNEMLWVRHSFDPSYWTFPGGTIEKDEEPKDTAIREVQEEVGIKLVEVVPIGSFKNRGDHKKDTVYCFHAEVVTKDLSLNDIELSEAKWFPIDTPPENMGQKNAKRIWEFYRNYQNMLTSGYD